MGVARRGWAVALSAAALAWAGAGRAQGPLEVVVRGAPGATTSLVISAGPGVVVEDRTQGAEKPRAGEKLAARGAAFAGEVRLFLRGARVPRSAVVEVGDPLVSEMRVFAEPQGAQVTIFVRQPVDYTVEGPLASGGLTLRLQARPGGVGGVARRKARGKVKIGGPGPGEITVDADSIAYEHAGKLIIARGAVTVRRGETSIRADEVRVDRERNLAEAAGNVVITDPEGVVKGRFVHLDLEDESGWIDEGRLFLRKTGYFVEGDRLEKGGGNTYHLAGGTFTTCQCGGLERPTWSITGKSVDVMLQGYGRARHAAFRLKGVPVLYLPLAFFPVKTRRQTGFLMPRFGSSNRRGFQYEQPFFWAINKSMDATVAVDLETAARVGVLGEYRYALSRKAEGEIAGSYFNEQIRGSAEGTSAELTGPVDVPEHRWSVVGRHVQPLAPGVRAYADVFAVSDDFFLREINSFAFNPREDINVRTRRFTTTRGGVIGVWNHTLAWIDSAYYQDLLRPQAVTLQRLPRIEIERRGTIFGERLVGSVSAEGVHYYREDGFQGVRLDLRPRLTLPFRLGRAIDGAISGGLRETAYHLTDTTPVLLEPPPGNRGPIPRAAPLLPGLERDTTREMGDVLAQVGTRLERVYSFPHWGLARLKHTIEPEVEYLFVPRVGQEELPLFDGVDRVRRRSLVTYGVVSRLLGREAEPAPETSGEASAASAGPARPMTAPRELARVSLLQGYDTERQIAAGEHFTDVTLGLRLTPAPAFALTLNTIYNVAAAELKGESVGLLLREPWVLPGGRLRQLQSPTQLGLSYRFVAEDAAENAGIVAAGLEELDGSLFLRLGAYAGLSFLSRYDVRSATFLENDFGLRLISRCECWALEIGVADKTNPDETLFRAQLTLVGLGSFGRGRGRRGSYLGLGAIGGPGFLRRYGG